MKRFLSLALVFVLLFSMTTPAMANSQYQSSGTTLSDLGILRGDEEGNLMLGNYFRRQDMVIMISRLYKSEDVAKQYQGKNVFKDLTATRKFYVPYITWAKDKGLIQGMEVDEFGFNRNTTIHEFQTILLRVLGYVDEAKNWNNVPNFAEGIGLMDFMDSKSSDLMTRGEMSQMVLNALYKNVKGQNKTLAEQLGLEIPSEFRGKVIVEGNKVLFEGQVLGTRTLKLYVRPTSSLVTTGAQTYDIPLDSEGKYSYALVDQQKGNYEYRLEGDRDKTVFESYVIEDENFDLVDIGNNNLKEISLTFNREIDKDTASFTDKYETDAGRITDVIFENNNKTITLVLDREMRNGSKYTLSAKNIKSKSNSIISLENEVFTAEGSSIPTVVNYLGKNNTIMIEFSSPMDMTTVYEHRNYTLELNNRDIATLPTTSKIETKDNKNILITLPTTINGKDVEVGDSIIGLEMRGIKDANGNELDRRSSNIDFYRNNISKAQTISYSGKSSDKHAYLEDMNTLKVKFNVPITKASVSDFSLSSRTGMEIKSVKADGSNIVTLDLINKGNEVTSIPDGLFELKYNNKLGNALNLDVEGGEIKVLDGVPPMILPGLNSLVIENDAYVYIPFTEELEIIGNNLMAKDFVVMEDRNVLDTDEYDVFVDRNRKDTVVILIKKFDTRARYTVKLGDRNDRVSFVMDLDGNLAKPSKTYEVK